MVCAYFLSVKVKGKLNMKKLLLATLITASAMSSTAFANEAEGSGKIGIGPPTTNATITWTKDVSGICGVRIRDTNSEITFKGADLDHGAEIHVRSNTGDKPITLSFTEEENKITPADGVTPVTVAVVQDNGLAAEGFTLTSGNILTVFAQASIEQSDVLIGSHSYSSIVTIVCDGANVNP